MFTDQSMTLLIAATASWFVGELFGYHILTIPVFSVRVLGS